MDELRVISSTEHGEVVQVWDCPKVANATRGVWRPGFAFPMYSSTPRFRPNDPRGEFANSIKSAGEPFSRDHTIHGEIDNPFGAGRTRMTNPWCEAKVK